MNFTSRQIELASQCKALGLPWEPAVGHYVYDATGAVKPSSPFQDHVYFLLNYDCFMQRVGGVVQFKRLMTWLPTWSDAREILRSLGASNADVQQEILCTNAVEHDSELLVLYEMIGKRLTATSEAKPPKQVQTC